MKNVDDINSKDLRSALKALNDSGILESKINMVGMKKEEMVKLFAAAVEGVPDEKSDDIPDSVVDFYNANISQATPDPDAEGETTGEGEITGEGGPPEKKEPEKKEKQPKARKGNKTDFMLAMLKQKMTDEQIWPKWLAHYKENGVEDEDFIKRRFRKYKGIAEKVIAAENKAAE